MAEKVLAESRGDPDKVLVCRLSDTLVSLRRQQLQPNELHCFVTIREEIARYVRFVAAIGRIPFRNLLRKELVRIQRGHKKMKI